MQFQSTLPREERLSPTPFISDNPCYFNPRSHERSDDDKNKYLYIYDISIHAPTRGATTTIKSLRLLTSISIHAPTRGATFPFCHGILKK